MERKSVSHIITAEKVNMDGIYLDQPLPAQSLDSLDPFLLIHHWNNALKGDSRQNEVGVGPHPHRGFSPVTFVVHGAVQHQDSRGNNSIVSEGGTQWMNAGMGIVHSERPEKKLAHDGGPFEIIQFWVNSPSARKMDQPTYQPIQAEETPVYVTPDGLMKVAVVAGEQFGLQGPAKSVSPILALRIEAQKGAKIDIEIPADFNSLLYNLNGNLTINTNQRCFMKDMVVFDAKSGSSTITIEANETTKAIVLAGLPLNEEVVKYGPFVMNSQTEIMEAMRDSQMGKMGILIEEFD